MKKFVFYWNFEKYNQVFLSINNKIMNWNIWHV